MSIASVIHWLASSVASEDGTPSSTRILGIVVGLAFVVDCFLPKHDVGTLGVMAGFSATCLGIRDGGPLDTYFAQKAASSVGASPPPPSASS